MQIESGLSDEIIKETLINPVRLIVDELIHKRLESVIEVLEKSKLVFITELEAFDILDVSPSTFRYYKYCGLLNGVVSGKGTEQSYKLSEVLALIQS